MHTIKWFQVLLSNTNNSIQHYSFAYTHLNGLKYSKSLNSSIWLIDQTLTYTTTRCPCGSWCNSNKGYPHSPKLKELSVTIRSFSVIAGTFDPRVSLFCSACSQCILGVLNSKGFILKLCKLSFIVLLCLN